MGNADLFVKREDEFIPSVDNFWKFKGNPSALVIKTVNKWFNKLIGDEVVSDEINLTEGDIGYLVKSVSSILKTLKGECEYTDQNVVEREVIALPVVRFPSLDDDNIVIYKDAVDSMKKNPNHEGGLTGSFLTAAFGPRHSVIDQISDAVKAKAIKSVMDKFAVEPSA